MPQHSYNRGRPMSTAEAPASTAERELVLAVDDNEQNLQLLEEYLGGWGYDVVLAHDGVEALQSMRWQPAIRVAAAATARAAPAISSRRSQTRRGGRGRGAPSRPAT